MPGLNRLLKLLVVAAVLMLTVRLGSVWHDAGVAFAQNGSAAPAKAADANAKPAEAPGKPADATAKPADVPAKPADAQAADGKPVSPDAAKPAAAQKFSASEVEILQSLSKRRAELDQRSEALDQRELLLKATEQRVQEKIDKLQTMQAQVDAALGKVDEQEDQRLQSLVRIYETMKPQEAATIFDKLEQPVLMQVLTRMKDRSVAAILPHLDGDKARAITIALAEHKQMPDLKTN
jgi:flagellar motility protein MotE (MotC chaperone)